jgi:thiazole synthase
MPAPAHTPLSAYGVELGSRLFLGTAQYPSPHVLAEAIRASGAEVLTVSLRRESARANAGQRFYDLLKDTGARVLPNTAGCRTVKDAVTTAQLARELFDTPWIKLEVIANDDTLQPDLFGLVEAAGILVRDGFEVFPYTTEDLGAAERLLSAGCQILMPWGAPIGSGLGIQNRVTIRLIVEGAKVPVLVDAGVGTASDAAVAMELGCDGVLMNTAIAEAKNPIAMATAMKLAVQSGRMAYLSGRMGRRMYADPSSPLAGLI